MSIAVIVHVPSLLRFWPRRIVSPTFRSLRAAFAPPFVIAVSRHRDRPRPAVVGLQRDVEPEIAVIVIGRTAATDPVAFAAAESPGTGGRSAGPEPEPEGPPESIAGSDCRRPGFLPRSMAELRPRTRAQAMRPSRPQRRR